MRARMGLVGLMALVMALAVGSFAIVGARQAGVEEPVEIHLFDVTTAQAFADDNNDEPPFHAGDRFLFRENSFDFDNRTKKLGDAAGVCTVLPGKPAFTTRCDVTLNLKDGTIETSGILHESTTKFSTFAIVGGTGNYQNARGQLRVRSIETADDEPGEVEIIVSIIP